MKKYIILLQQFINQDIQVEVFESIYLNMFKNDNDNLPEKAFLILDKLFGDIDMFCPDENLREDGDLSEPELRDAAMRAMNELLEYSKHD